MTVTEDGGGATTEEPGGGDAAAGAEVFAQLRLRRLPRRSRPRARPGPGRARRSTDTALTEAQIATLVTNGKGSMPAFADRLSEEEIADVAAYVAGG